MSCNAPSQASPSDLPGLKHETVQVAVWSWPTMGTTTTPNAFSQSAKVFISAIISRSISSFVFGNFSMSMIYGTLSFGAHHPYTQVAPIAAAALTAGVMRDTTTIEFDRIRRRAVSR
jgi:hypothetical protein